MPKIILISMLLFSSLFSKQLFVYKITENTKKQIATLTYPDDIDVRYSFVSVVDYKTYINLVPNDLKQIFIYDLDGNLIIHNKAAKEDNVDIRVGNNQNLYKWVQRKNTYYIFKKRFKDKNWEQIAYSKDKYIHLTQEESVITYDQDYTNKNTVITKNSSEIIKINKILFPGCGILENSLIITENASNNMTNFYEIKNKEMSFLGQLSQNEYSVHDYLLFNGSPKLMFYKGNIVYHFINQKLEILKDFSKHKNINSINYSNNSFYGVSF